MGGAARPQRPSALRLLAVGLLAAPVLGVSRPHAYYFLAHCPKTGGSSLNVDLWRTAKAMGDGTLRKCGNINLCWGAQLRFPNTSLDVLHKTLRQVAPAQPCGFASCELPLRPSLARIGVQRGLPPVRVLLMLRLPSAHVVSHYAHVHRFVPSAERPTLEAWLRAQHATAGQRQTGWHAYNMQTAHLTAPPEPSGALASASGYGTLVRNATARAKARLDAAFFVGILEQYTAAFCLAVHYIWPRMPPPVPCTCAGARSGETLSKKDHGTNTKSTVPTVSAEAQDAIAALTRYDEQVYAHARARFEQDFRRSPVPRCLLRARGRVG